MPLERRTGFWFYCTLGGLRARDLAVMI